ncbi:MAG: sodium-dependent transporter [Clostridiales bacterium]|nr:sodium-dependent transporter [Clostridiales bacterium]
MDNKLQEQRGSWGSNIGFLMAAVGSAVGLGNIWGFPFRLGAGGGFAFLLVYLILVVFVGYVVMLGELTIGRKTGKSTVHAYVELSKKYKAIGFMGIVSGFCILAFYSVLGGYVMKYMFGFLMEMFRGDNFGGMSSGEYFDNFLGNVGQGTLWFVVFQAITILIVMGGVAGGIEKFCKIAMPALVVMLVIVIIRSVTLPGATEGLAFMFKPDFSKLATFSDFMGVLRSAAGQMFFSLSLGMGCMITYGSYLSKKESLQFNAMFIPIADTTIAILAGMAVMPAVFALGFEPGRGPGLLFVTLHGVFMSMGGFIGPFFGFFFYLLVTIAAVTSSISLLEVCASYVIDKRIIEGKEPNRRKYTIMIGAAIFVVGLPISLDGLGAGIMPALPESLGWVWLELYDFIAEGVLMPLGALFMSLIVGWVMKKSFGEEVRLEGNKFGTESFVMICAKYITPIAMTFILVTQVMDFFGM